MLILVQGKSRPQKQLFVDVNHFDLEKKVHKNIACGVCPIELLERDEEYQRKILDFKISKAFLYPKEVNDYFEKLY